jgi:hypothetical protein
MIPATSYRAAAFGPLVIVGLAMLALGCATADTGTARQAAGADAPTPAPAPTPTPAATPTPAPVPADALYVPASIDATGSRDVSAELQSFILNAPDGSTIVFKAGGTYRLGMVIKMFGLNGITIEGNGATLRLTNPSGTGDSAALKIAGPSQDITIRNLTIIGNHAAAGTKDACCGRESQHAFQVHGSSDVLIERVDISRIGGDCLYIDVHWDNRDLWSERVTFRDSTCRLVGRVGVSVTGGRDVRVVNNVFDEIGYSVIGIEPDGSRQGASNVVIRGNTIGSYGLMDWLEGHLLYACDAPWGGGATVRDVTITGNTVAGNRSGYDGQMHGLDVLTCGDGHHGPRKNITVTNNTAKQPVVGPVMRFIETDGVTVTGNTQPLSSGQLAAFPGSTGVTYEGNNE